jgi:acyl-CoA thioesterase FadM
MVGEGLCWSTIALRADRPGFGLGAVGGTDGLYSLFTGKLRVNLCTLVFVSDLVSVHASLVKVGKTSITVRLEAWVMRRKEMHSILVTDGNFVYVAIDDQGHPQTIQRTIRR